MEKDQKELNSVVVALKKGDSKTFEKLYTDYYEKLCTYSLNYVSDKDVVQDVVQDAFVSLWINRNKIAVTTSLKSYLYRMVFNKLMDFHRKNKLKDKMLLSYYNTVLNRIVENTDDNDIYKAERIKQLESCIEALPNRCKNVFIAKKINGLKYQQVSEKLHISVKTVEGHVTRAYSFIKNCMHPKDKP